MARLIPAERRRAVMAVLGTEGVASIKSLAERFGVSEMTVRRDIAVLEAESLATAVSGGAVLAAGSQPPERRESRAALHADRKRAIARAAAEAIRPGMTVFLDAGTTCQSLAELVAGIPSITVVTNDFSSVHVLMGSQVRLIHTGGAVDAESGSADGPLAARLLQSMRLDVAFLSAGAWDLRKGLTTTSTDKLVVKTAALESAATSVLLADSSKYGAFARFGVIGLHELGGVITDDRLDQSVEAQLVGAGVAVQRASLAGSVSAGPAPRVPDSTG